MRSGRLGRRYAGSKAKPFKPGRPSPSSPSPIHPSIIDRNLRYLPPPPSQVWMRLDVSGLHPKPSPARASAPRHGKGVFSTCPISASFDLPPDSLLHYTSTCINLLIESTDWTPRGCIHHAAARPQRASLACAVRAGCIVRPPTTTQPVRPPRPCYE